jgi:putative ABC transport system permease protein
MLKNFFKTALRNLTKHKGYSLLNILGLAIGMACSLLILMYVQDELSYDRFNENADRIYRISTFFRMGGREGNIATAAAATGPDIMAEFPEVLDATRFRQRGSYIVRYGDNSFKERRTVFADESFFRMFSIPLVKGDPATALKQPNTLVLSQTTADKIFGIEDPVGKLLRLDDRDDYMVTGIYKDIPHNSHFHFDVIMAMAGLEESRDPTWLSQNFQTYLLLAENTDITALEEKFPNLLMTKMGPYIQRVIGQSLEKLIESGEIGISMSLQPLRDIHLRSDLEAELEANSDIKYVYIFTAIALFILVIASINFMNLATARASGRAKEVGIRKVLGSDRAILIRQFLTESMILSLISLALALIMVLLTLPLFNQLTGKAMILFALLTPAMLAAILGVTLATGLLAGSYPAFVISAFQPGSALKGKVRSGVRTGALRSSLVVFQFAASIILIISTLVVSHQLHYIRNAKLGYDKEQVIILEDAYLLRDQAETFKNEMLKHSQFTCASISGYLPIPSSRNQTTVFPAGNFNHPGTTSIQCWEVDHDYIKTLDMKIIQGRDFSREFSTDSEATIINQQTAKQYGFENPLGERLSRPTSNDGDIASYTVIGVVEDFHFDSLRETIQPLIMYLGNSTGRISFRFQAAEVDETIQRLRATWKEFLPYQPFAFSFLDDRFDSVYKSERQIGRIFGIFAGLAVFVGCLGLFGLAAFLAEKRSKEIGIRKVLGASVPTVIRLLMKEFLILVGLANLAAWPIAYFAMNGWLKNFAYRTSIGLWIFLAAGAATIIIALMTVSYQSIRAALSDPVDSLRYE